jgi:hypothetical protein
LIAIIVRSEVFSRLPDAKRSIADNANLSFELRVGITNSNEEKLWKIA